MRNDVTQRIRIVDLIRRVESRGGGRSGGERGGQDIAMVTIAAAFAFTGARPHAGRRGDPCSTMVGVGTGRIERRNGKGSWLVLVPGAPFLFVFAT
jgi:hypothetical protein